MSTRPENTFANTNFEALVKVDEKIAHFKDAAYSKAVNAERFEAAKAGLEAKGFKVTVAQNKDEAFETLKTLIPEVCSPFAYPSLRRISIFIFFFFFAKPVDPLICDLPNPCFYIPLFVHEKKSFI